MGFVSYSREYLMHKLTEYETRYRDGAPAGIVHEAKVLLKMLEDIRDEGYTRTYDSFSAEFDCVNRLRGFIHRNHETPFALLNYSVSGDPEYSGQTVPLFEYLPRLERVMGGEGPLLDETPPVFQDLLDYTRHFYQHAQSDTAYVFLLRDTLLPYLAFRKWDAAGKLALYPYLIGRKYLSFFHEDDEGNLDPKGDSGALYDSLHEGIFAALSENPGDLDTFLTLVRQHIRSELALFPKAAESIKNLLKKIPHKKILVIESGFIGTIPLLLHSLDDRVDFCLFTTIPYFYELYRDRFFTNAFEKIRLFETIQCQDALCKLSAIENDRFLVSETNDAPVTERAYMELRTWNRIVSA